MKLEKLKREDEFKVIEGEYIQRDQYYVYPSGTITNVISIEKPILITETIFSVRCISIEDERVTCSISDPEIIIGNEKNIVRIQYLINRLGKLSALEALEKCGEYFNKKFKEIHVPQPNSEDEIEEERSLICECTVGWEALGRLNLATMIGVPEIKRITDITPDGFIPSVGIIATNFLESLGVKESDAPYEYC